MLFVHQQDMLPYYSLTLVLACSTNVQGHEVVMPWDSVFYLYLENDGILVLKSKVSLF
jgi:hypothetical protein